MNGRNEVSRTLSREDVQAHVRAFVRARSGEADARLPCGCVELEVGPERFAFYPCVQCRTEAISTKWAGALEALS